MVHYINHKIVISAVDIISYKNHVVPTLMETVFSSLDIARLVPITDPAIFVMLAEEPLSSIMPTYESPEALFPTSTAVALEVPISKLIVSDSLVDP